MLSTEIIDLERPVLNIKSGFLYYRKLIYLIVEILISYCHGGAIWMLPCAMIGDRRTRLMRVPNGLGPFDTLLPQE
jgi:hypothetical protein